MKISIIGTGYVGLITGVCLAVKGHDVTCFDSKLNIIEGINSKSPHFYENGLPEMLSTVLEKGNFSAKLINEDLFEGSELIIIAVGTPNKNDKMDLSQIKEAAIIIGRFLRKTSSFVSIIVKSTVLPGTTDTFVKGILEEYSGKTLGEFGLGMNPEFLREGEALDDFMNSDRIVLGHEDSDTLEILHKLYSPWNCDKLEVNTRTAEMIKYANNGLLATQISTVNELANIAFAIGGIDIQEVMEGVLLDKRWSPILQDGNRVIPGILKYLVPGCGFGGSCFPKDIRAIKNHAIELGIQPHLLNAVLKINDQQPYQVINLLKSSLGDLSNKKILILGLSFKEGTNDIRESVSIKVIEYLQACKSNIIAHDPISIDKARKAIKESDKIEFIDNWEEILSDLDGVIIMTKWQEYKKLDSSENILKLEGKTIVDPRKFFSPNTFPKSKYLTVGRNILIDT